jgi:hypothetical protein
MRLQGWLISHRGLLAILLTVSLVGKAADFTGDEHWDAQYGVPGMDNQVFALITQDGWLYAGGWFSDAGGVAASQIALWDGLRWSPLGAGTQGTVEVIAREGQIVYAGGQFTVAGGLAATNIARWDGTNWSGLGPGLEGTVRAISPSAQDLHAGGQFLLAGVQPVNNIARWDGTHWWPLGEGLWVPGGAEFAAVFSLLVKGNDLYVGGRFHSAGGIGATNIARWDRTNWWPLGDGLNGQVHDLAFVGESLYACGQFLRAGSVQAARIARWDGTNWHSLGASFYSSFGLELRKLTTSGEDLYVGGTFDEVSGVPARGVARWDGSRWWGLGSGVEDGGALAATGSELYVGSLFYTAGGKPSRNIALWHIPHSLEVSRNGGEVRLSWPATGSNYVVEATANLQEPVWQQLDQTPVVEGNRLTVAEPLSPTQRLYRLRKPWPPGSVR